MIGIGLRLACGGFEFATMTICRWDKGQKVEIRQLGSSSLSVSVLGYGCSRIGSLATPASTAEMLSVMEDAVAGGITFFDTANVYGQGDSERTIALLEAKLGKRLIVCTKAGLSVRVPPLLVRAAKPLVRPLIKRSRASRRSVQSARQTAERTNFDSGHILKQVHGSLRRLKRQELDLFLLHSPPASVLKTPEIFALLEHIREQGLAKHVGVSCRDLADVEICLEQPVVEVLQLPLPGEVLNGASDILAQAEKQGVGVIAREVLSSVDKENQDGVEDALRRVVSMRGVSTALVGMTSADHLHRNLSAIERSMSLPT